MTKITFTPAVVDSTTTNTDFKDLLAVNHDKQWLDEYGVIKTNRDNINESITIRSDTNRYSAGTITIGAGHSVTVNGEWRIV